MIYVDMSGYHMTRLEMIEEFLKLRPYLLGVIFAVGAKDYAEDVMQEVALSIWYGSPFTNKGKCTYKTWLATVTRNAAFGMHRKNHRLRSHEDIDAPTFDLPSSEPCILTVLIHAEKVAKLKELITTQLSTNAKESVNLYLNEHPNRYAHNIKVRRTRALIKLRAAAAAGGQ